MEIFLQGALLLYWLRKLEIARWVFGVGFEALCKYILYGIREKGPSVNETTHK